MSWESVCSDDDTAKGGNGDTRRCMTQNDNSPVRAGTSGDKSAPGLLRRILSIVFPTRWTGRADGGLAAGTEIAGVIENLETCVRQGRPIKTGGPIDVRHTTWRGREVVVKWYKHVGWLHSLRHTLKGSRARRAWGNARRLLDLGIPTPRPLAFFDEHYGPLLWQSYLVTGYVEGPNLRSVLCDASMPEGRKRRLIHQTLRLLDRLGSHGIRHGDMKHTNVLCPGSRIMLTDLDGMGIHKLRCFSRRHYARDIARFLRRMAPQQETRGLKCEAEGGIQMPDRGLLELPSTAGRTWVNRDFRSHELEEVLSAGPQALAEHFRPQPVQASPASRVGRFTATFNGERVGVYFKEYLDRSLWDRLKHLVRPSRAVRATGASQMLGRHGFHVPEIICLGSFGAGLRARSFLATREVTDGVPVYKYLMPAPPTLASVPCSLREKRQLLRQFGQTVGRMHRAGIAHGDLRPGNILARRAHGGWEFFFIDNERTRKWPFLPTHLRLKNLVQINMLPWGVTNTDRLRFFQAYLLMNPKVRRGFRKWAGKIMRLTYKRFRQRGWLAAGPGAAVRPSTPPDTPTPSLARDE
jgi:tRNA A-37 threonylcarbamoyl transferase component Bud32